MTPVAVRCRDLSYRYGDHLAVDGVDLEVTAGEVLGLLGPNGAGKTTTLRMLTAQLPPYRGTAEVFGHDVARDSLAVRRALGYVPQQLSADSGLTGRENVALFARLFDVPRRQRRAAVDDAIEAMGLADAADRMAATYSGGMVRRLELAQALVNRPRLLVLDEPTIGLDPLARAGVWARVEELRSATGMTVLLTTHYMEEADQMCDRVALMHWGKVTTVGRPADLKAAQGAGASLEDVYVALAHQQAGTTAEEGGRFRDVNSARRTASRLG
ncbi:MAG: ATP-binding cassette domain-containing protein [Actinomycetota bacterium]|nr:MAG: ATP-binding cassette domain-containing protein [Actinomycetota bacterium]